ncbi:hypothetical protein [Methylobacterium soli]|nr:hypothetical protein [Methylobacterium soli]
MRGMLGDQDSADARVENGEEHVEEDDPHHGGARRAFEDGQHV